MARLSIRLLGPFQVVLEGEPVTDFESDKVRALLAYLAVTPDQPHRRERLAGLLWPDYPERSARASLRNALAILRGAIDDRHASPPFLHITRHTIQFNSESDHWLDTNAFTAPLTSSRPSSEELEEAIGCYRGAFLEGFSTPDSVAFEEWLLFKREELGHLMLEALHRVVERYEERGSYEKAIVHARRWVELEPWQEEGHQRVMRLLALTGRRSEALAQYEKCGQLLREELGAEPSAETQALYEAIRSGELTQAAVERPGDREIPVPRPPRPIYNLPVQPTPFVGRQQELSTLLKLLTDPAVRVVTIVGPGGIGKTRLALAVGVLAAEAHGPAEPGGTAPAFPHGIVFVPLAPLSSAQDIIPAVAEAFQLRLEGGQEQLFEYLRRKQLLLILDNLEHLADGAGLLSEILSAAPGTKILTTSRERLQLHAEQVFPIQGLAFPEQDPAPSTLASVDVDTYVEGYPAIALLVASARRLLPTFAPDRDNLTACTRICRVVEGMPLALELAAGWVDTLSLDDILAEIEGSLSFLQTEWRDIPRRQRSMRAVFDTSWGRLDQAEQALFPQLSVFRGGFTRTAAEQVAMGGIETAILPRLLSRLVSKSFIQYDQALNRYQIHELLRQYGAERLALDSGHEAEVRDRHSRYFCDWLSGQEADLKGARQQEAVADIEADLDNVRSACNWAASQGQAKRLIQAVGALGPFYRWHNCQAGETVFGNLAEKLSGAYTPASPMTDIAQRATARILMWQSTYSGLLGSTEHSQQLAQACLRLLDSPPLAGQDTRLERAYVWWRFGYISRYTDTEAAKESFARSRSLFREVGDRWGQAIALSGLGRAARNLRAFEEAEEAITESLALRQALGDNQGSAEALALLGNVAWFQAQFAKAERLLRQSLAITQKTDREGIARGLFHLGVTLYLSGRFAEARRTVMESIALYIDLGIRLMDVTGTIILAQALRHLGEYEAARAEAEKALSGARAAGFGIGVGWALATLGAVALAEEAYDQALERSEESLAVEQREAVSQSPLDEHLAWLGLASRGLGHLDEAKRYLLTQLERAEGYRPLPPLLSALSGIALLLADDGREERAVEVYALAGRHPIVANSHWFEDVAGREMAAVAARLPPGVAEAARARGQEGDLRRTASELLEALRTEFGQDES